MTSQIIRSMVWKCYWNYFFKIIGGMPSGPELLSLSRQVNAYSDKRISIIFRFRRSSVNGLYLYSLAFSFCKRVANTFEKGKTYRCNLVRAFWRLWYQNKKLFIKICNRKKYYKHLIRVMFKKMFLQKYKK